MLLIDCQYPASRKHALLTSACEAVLAVSRPVFGDQSGYLWFGSHPLSVPMPDHVPRLALSLTVGVPQEIWTQNTSLDSDMLTMAGSAEREHF